MTQEQLRDLSKMMSARRHLRMACDEALERLDKDISNWRASCDHTAPDGTDMTVIGHADAGGVVQTSTCVLCDGGL